MDIFVYSNFRVEFMLYILFDCLLLQGLGLVFKRNLYYCFFCPSFFCWWKKERERANVSLFTKCDFLSKRDWVGCSLSSFFPWVFQIFSSVQHHPFSWHIWASNFPFPLLHIQILFSPILQKAVIIKWLYHFF